MHRDSVYIAWTMGYFMNYSVTVARAGDNPAGSIQGQDSRDDSARKYAGGVGKHIVE